MIDLCAGAGGKALALAAAAPDAQDHRLRHQSPAASQLGPRAARAGAEIAVRLLDAGKEKGMLADLAGQADVVLVDAPCSGPGTWRRNPEGRWRLTPERLDRVVALQAQIARARRGAGQAGRGAGLRVLLGARREGAGQAERPS